MKYCSQCGKGLNDDVQFCPGCGYSFPASPQQQSYASYQQPQYPPYQQPQYAAPPQPMKWFKFLVNFLLIFTAVGCFLGSIAYFNGTATIINSIALYDYDDPEEMIEAFEELVEVLLEGGEFEISGELKTCGTVSGILMLVIGGLFIAAWYYMKNFSKTGITLFYASLIAQVANNILYYFLLSSAVESYGAKLNFSSVVIAVIIDGVYIFLNYIYFKKRTYMFR